MARPSRFTRAVGFGPRTPKRLTGADIKPNRATAKAGREITNVRSAVKPVPRPVREKTIKSPAAVAARTGPTGTRATIKKAAPASTIMSDPLFLSLPLNLRRQILSDLEVNKRRLDRGSLVVNTGRQAGRTRRINGRV